MHPRGLIPFEEFTLFTLPGLFFKFVFFTICVFCLGNLSLSYLKIRINCIGFKFALGIILFAIASGLIGLCGEFRYINLNYLTPLMLIIPAIDGVLNHNPSVSNLSFSYFKLNQISFNSEGLIKVILWITITTIFWVASSPSQYEDPLYYGLTFVSRFLESGLLNFSIFNPSELITSWWELFISWAYLLVGGPDSSGQIEGLIICQWAHVFFGVVCSMSILDYLISKTPAFSNYHTNTYLIALFILPIFNTVTATAKSDWAMLLFLLSALCIYTSSTNKVKTKYFLSGVFLGVFLTVKLSSIFLFIPILFLLPIVLLTQYKNIKWRSYTEQILFIGVGVAVISMPFFIRNYYFSSNPTYPLNPFGLTDTWETITNLFVRDHALTIHDRLYNILNITRKLVMVSPLIILSPFCFILLIKENENKLIFFYSAVFLSLILFVFKCSNYKIDGLLNFKDRFFRYIGTSICLLNILSILYLNKIFSNRIKIIKPLNLILVLAIVINGVFLNPRLAASSGFRKPVRHFWTHHVGGMAKIWIRKNISNKKLIASSNEYRRYLINDYRFFNIMDYPPAFKIIKNSSMKEILLGLNQMSVDYIYISKFNANLTQFSLDLRHFIEDYPKTVLFDSEMSQIIDLKLLIRLMSS